MHCIHVEAKIINEFRYSPGLTFVLVGCNTVFEFLSFIYVYDFFAKISIPSRFNQYLGCLIGFAVCLDLWCIDRGLGFGCVGLRFRKTFASHRQLFVVLLEHMSKLGDVFDLGMGC